MRRLPNGRLLFSPSDLICFLKSPFASWMERYNLEYPGKLKPDEETEDERLIAETGNKHEEEVLKDLRRECPGLVEIPKQEIVKAAAATLEAFEDRAPIVYQAALMSEPFAGFADFVLLNDEGLYEIWDTKLATAPKPYYAVQLCCYSEMLAATLNESLPEEFGIILGTKEKDVSRTEDYIHYYRRLKSRFLELQNSFDGDFANRPEPHPRGDHGHWDSYAKNVFKNEDHLIQVANISVGQIKNLKKAGILTVEQLSGIEGGSVPKLQAESLNKLIQQARLQRATSKLRDSDPEAKPVYELLDQHGPNGEPLGLASLPPAHDADVFFDMEGYPLIPGGLEYLFGACYREPGKSQLQFIDWWAHDRGQEKAACEGFIDWVYDRWKKNPGMHIYHYAAYEVSAVRRLSTRHDTRQEEVDELLRHEVFVDLYQVVRQGLRVGEPSYSIKSVEKLYRPKRSTQVATAIGSMVHYARWMTSEQPGTWEKSPILKGIRDYNEDDCVSTAELEAWLRNLAKENRIECRTARQPDPANPTAILNEAAQQRRELVEELRQKGDPVAPVLADLVEFHRREDKPMWWKMFDRAVASVEALRDDASCIAQVVAVGSPEVEKQSLVQSYRFDPDQECKLSAGEKTKVMFTHNLEAKLTLVSLDARLGTLQLKLGNKSVKEKFGGAFPTHGCLIPDEHVNAEPIPKALAAVAEKHLANELPAAVSALLNRVPPSGLEPRAGESTVDAAIRIAKAMQGGCMVIQGPPGTGKSYTASHVICALLSEGKRVGIASNSHKAITNLIRGCHGAMQSDGRKLIGVKAGGSPDDELFKENPEIVHVGSNGEALDAYQGGVVGGTAWLFSRDDWEGQLDYLFIDEAGQVALANAVAMARSAKNLVLLGDQMQLEQPIQGSHPGDAGMSVLQYALKDPLLSKPDSPIFHAVIPSDVGLFLGESHRMHSGVCRFISEAIYESRLKSHSSCDIQRIEGVEGIGAEAGIVFLPVEHDGNVQKSEEEVEKVVWAFKKLNGRSFVRKDGSSGTLSLSDFIFIAPYNAQVRALEAALPCGAKVGSVDRYQGQEAHVCILSLCSSFGEYGSRGLGFILDRNRINVAMSRAKCLAIVVADPRIADTPVGSLGDMRLLNLFCKLQSEGTR